MKTSSVIILLLFVFIFVMADINLHNFYAKTTIGADSVSMQKKHDSIGVKLSDSTALDSLHLAIRRHNQMIDDSLRQDSLNKKKEKGIEAPVNYTANDSLIYLAKNKTAYLYGSSTVRYENMDLKSDRIQMCMDSNLVHATGAIKDTVTKALEGTPQFKLGNDAYESDTMAFNFKTKKGLIRNVYTKQEDGFLRSERSKRDSSGVVYMEHGRYTTCDKKHPDFYIALSRGKVRPGKDVIFGPAYLVVADVPLPLAIPYGFFPFTKSYSSGFIMPVSYTHLTLPTTERV